MATTIQAKISAALNSANVGTREEGRVAQLLLDAGINIVSFQRLERDFVTGNAIGDVDIETDKAVIEVTLQPNRKLWQLEKLRLDRQLNPAGKQVVFYAPHYRFKAALTVKKASFWIAQSDAELLSFLASLP